MREADGWFTPQWKKCKKLKCNVTAARVGKNGIGFCSGIADKAPVKLKNSRIGKDWITLCIINLDKGIRQSWSLKTSEANEIIHCLSQSIDEAFENRRYENRMKKLAKTGNL